MKPPLQTNKPQEYFYQKLLKSVKICQTYWEKFIATFFTAHSIYVCVRACVCVCPLPSKVLDFFASEWYILRAFWHMVKQFTSHNAGINKVKSLKKLRYRHQTVQSRHQVMF